MRHLNGRRKEPEWGEVAKSAEIWGWFGQRVGKDSIVLERGRQRIEAKRIPAVNRWKVEYYSESIMDDTTGLGAESLAKRDTVEMALGK